MTVQFEIPHIFYKGNDVTTVFPFTWSSDDDNETKVRLNGVLLTEGIEYELEKYTEENGGEVRMTLEDPLTSTDLLLLFRQTPITQEVDYVETTAFPAETHEGQMDKDTRILQELFNSGLGSTGPVDLSAVQFPTFVDVLNTAGSDARLLPWSCNDDLAGVFYGEITEAAPNDGQVTTRPDGYVWFEVIL